MVIEQIPLAKKRLIMQAIVLCLVEIVDDTNPPEPLIEVIVDYYPKVQITVEEVKLVLELPIREFIEWEKKRNLDESAV